MAMLRQLYAESDRNQTRLGNECQDIEKAASPRKSESKDKKSLEVLRDEEMMRRAKDLKKFQVA